MDNKEDASTKERNPKIKGFKGVEQKLKEKEEKKDNGT